MEKAFFYKSRGHILGQGRKNRRRDPGAVNTGGAESIDPGGTFIRFVGSVVKKLHWHYSWIVPLALFLVHQYLQYWVGLPLKLADAYLDPFCAGALALSATSFERRLFFGQLQLTVADMLVTTSYIVFVSEVLFPSFSEHFVADWGDAIAIFMGLGWFLLTCPRRVAEKAITRTPGYRLQK